MSVKSFITLAPGLAYMNLNSLNKRALENHTSWLFAQSRWRWKKNCFITFKSDRLFAADISTRRQSVRLHRPSSPQIRKPELHLLHQLLDSSGSRLALFWLGISLHKADRNWFRFSGHFCHFILHFKISCLLHFFETKWPKSFDFHFIFNNSVSSGDQPDFHCWFCCRRTKPLPQCRRPCRHHCCRTGAAPKKKIT